MERQDHLSPPDGDYWDGRAWVQSRGVNRSAPGASVWSPGDGDRPALQPGYPRWMVALTAAVILVALAGVATIGGVLLANQGPVPITADTNLSAPSPVVTSTPVAHVTPAPTARPATAKTVTKKPPAALPVLHLTASVSGVHCPVSNINDTACWHGTLVNTGPRIGRLVFILNTGGFTNWFSTHSTPMLSGFFTTPGCTADAAHSRVVCGPVAHGGKVSVYLVAGLTRVGTFRYAVGFADISSGRTVYIDQHANGTHTIVTWGEAISS